MIAVWCMIFLFVVLLIVVAWDLGGVRGDVRELKQENGNLLSRLTAVENMLRDNAAGIESRLRTLEDVVQGQLAAQAKRKPRKKSR